jgi:hypothetical protein
MDILSVASVRLPCSWCGRCYEVPLRDILLSHKIMHEGCPAPVETECPPVFQSRLASASAIKALDQAWRRLERRAAADGGELVLNSHNVERPVERSKDRQMLQGSSSEPSATRACILVKGRRTQGGR